MSSGRYDKNLTGRHPDPLDRPGVQITQFPDHPSADDTNNRLKLISENRGLQARGLGKYFGKKRVVRNISIGVRRGEAVGLLGPNGAGKTTTFYMLSGLMQADEGSIFLDGADVTETPLFQRARLGIGYLPQESSIFRGLSVEKNIRSVLEITEANANLRDSMLEELLAEFGIGHLRNTPSINLSGGERRRLEIARALAARPSFLLLDEPLAGIDPIAVADIRDLISQLKEHGLGVLITDHNVRETLEMVERAYIIHDGAVLMEGTPEEVVGHSGVREVYLGDRFLI